MSQVATISQAADPKSVMVAIAVVRRCSVMRLLTGCDGLVNDGIDIIGTIKTIYHIIIQIEIELCFFDERPSAKKGISFLFR